MVTINIAIVSIIVQLWTRVCAVLKRWRTFQKKKRRKEMLCLINRAYRATWMWEHNLFYNNAFYVNVDFKVIVLVLTHANVSVILSSTQYVLLVLQLYIILIHWSFYTSLLLAHTSCCSMISQLILQDPTLLYIYTFLTATSAFWKYFYSKNFCTEGKNENNETLKLKPKLLDVYAHAWYQ